MSSATTFKSLHREAKANNVAKILQRLPNLRIKYKTMISHLFKLAFNM